MNLKLLTSCNLALQREGLTLDVRADEYCLLVFGLVCYHHFAWWHCWQKNWFRKLAPIIMFIVYATASIHTLEF